MQSGSELYDSGIGFAVPLEDILSVLPRLQAGETLSPGIIGIGYRATDPFTSPAVVATCRSGSPAFAAGLRSGDEIIAPQGKSISRTRSFVMCSLLSMPMTPFTLSSSELLHHAQTMLILLPKKHFSNFHSQSLLWKAYLRIVGPVQGSSYNVQQEIHNRLLFHGSGRTVPRLQQASSPPIESSRIHETVIESATQLSGILAGLEPKALVPFHIKRNDTLIDIELTLGEVPVGVPDLIAQADLIEDAVQIETLEAPEVAKPPLAVLPKPSPHDDPSDDTTNNEMPLGILFSLMSHVDKLTKIPVNSGVRQLLDTESSLCCRVPLTPIAGAVRICRSSLAPLIRFDRGDRLIRVALRLRVAVQGAFAWMVAESFGGVFRGVALIDTGLPRSAKITPSDPGLPLSILFVRPLHKKQER